MQLPQRFAVELRHMENSGPDAEFRQYVCYAGEHSGDCPHADVGFRKEPGYRNDRPPRKNLGRPFDSRGPGEPSGELHVQLALSLLAIGGHRHWPGSSQLTSNVANRSLTPYRNQKGFRADAPNQDGSRCIGKIQPSIFMIANLLTDCSQSS